jgi:MFS family permease
MITDLGRAELAVTVAALLPVALPVGRARATAVSMAVATWGCGPVLDRWQGWMTVVATALIAGFVYGARKPRRGAIRIVTGTAAAAVITAALLGWEDARHGVSHALGDNGALVVTAGALLAVFVGGALIGFMLRPLARNIESNGTGSESLVNAGLYIGWLERALLYAFIVAGAPGAAAVVVTAKSIARFPSFGKERFAEYYLIGTLSSAAVATGAAFAARAILGLGPLVK